MAFSAASTSSHALPPKPMLQPKTLNGQCHLYCLQFDPNSDFLTLNTKQGLCVVINSSRHQLPEVMLGHMQDSQLQRYKGLA